MNPEDFWNLRPGLRGLLDFLRIVAALMGYVVAFVGWSMFFLLVIGSAATGTTQEIGEWFEAVAYLIVPGWLLLRFAAGLFPFGRWLFRWQIPRE